MVPIFSGCGKEVPLLDYLKCVIANPLLLAAYGFLAGAGALLYRMTQLAYASPGVPPEFTLQLSLYLTWGAGMLLLGATAGGTHTVDSYRRARRLLIEDGALNPHFLAIHTLSFCRRCGIRLAELEHRLARPSP